MKRYPRIEKMLEDGSLELLRTSGFAIIDTKTGRVIAQSTGEYYYIGPNPPNPSELALDSLERNLAAYDLTKQ